MELVDEEKIVEFKKALERTNVKRQAKRRKPRRKPQTPSNAENRPEISAE